MMKIVRILSGLLLSSWILNAFGAPHAFSEQIGEMHYWQELDWASAPTSAAWLDHNWVNYLGKQNSDENREKIQAFRLEGSEWQATLSQRRDNNADPHLLTIYTPAEDPPQDRCEALYHWAFKHFGAPQKTMDGSYRLPASGTSPEHRTIDRHYQWEIGHTRVTQECLGQFSGNNDAVPSYAASFLRFTAKDATPELHPLINAKCTRVLRLNDSSEIPLKMSDIVFVVDENNGSIRRSDLVPLRVRNVAVANTGIHFSITLDKSNNDYQIERPSGALTATMSIGGIRAGSVSGQCSLTPIITAQPDK